MMYVALSFLFAASVAVTAYAFYHQGRKTTRTRLAALEAENRRLQQSLEEKENLLDRARQAQAALQSQKLWYHGEHGRLTQFHPADEFLLEG